MIPLSRLLSTWPKYTAWSPNFFFSSSLGTPVVNISGLNLISTDFLFWLVLSAKRFTFRSWLEAILAV